MTIQYSVALNNSRLEAVELVANGQALAAGTGTGGSVTGSAAQPKLQLWTGSAPANCAAASTGTKLFEITLPADWMNAAASAIKGKAGTWSGTATAAGTAGYFRIVDNAGTNCHVQGTCGMSAADMILDNTNIASGQTVTVTAFTLNAANT
jgi:hypothetical protein